MMPMTCHRMIGGHQHIDQRKENSREKLKSVVMLQSRKAVRKGWAVTPQVPKPQKGNGGGPCSMAVFY